MDGGLLADVEALYKEVHQHPELSMQAERTATLAAGRLGVAGFDVTTGVGHTGVVGVLGNGDGPTVMLRADMDALPVQGQTGLDYASTVDGLALFCVTGASTALDHGVGAFEAVVLGAITGVGGGVLRDILVREIPAVLRAGLYAIPALMGAAVVAIASESGAHNLVFPIAGAALCFGVRTAGIYLNLNIPTARSHDD